MKIWLLMLLFDMIAPILMIAAGYLMPRIKTANSIIGYRTSLSMANEETWRYANGYCGGLWRKIGFIMLPVSIICGASMYFVKDAAAAVIGIAIMFIQLGIVFWSVYLVEKELKRKFANS